MKHRKIDPANATLLEVVYGLTGSYRKTARICAFVQAWAIVARSLGRRPSIEEYAEYWKVSRATAFREQAEFREAFPNAEPDEVGGVVASSEQRADFREVLA